MRALGIAGHDLHALSIALLSDNGVEREETFSASPETYLALLVSTLKEWGVPVDDLTHLVVVRGPGSFTASRVSTLIANALGWTKKIPMIAIENSSRLGWNELAKTIPWSEASDHVVLPLYDRPPHITQPS